MVRQLSGHAHGVVSLSFTVPSVAGASPLLLSGSWDGTAKVFCRQTTTPCLEFVFQIIF